MKKHGSVICLSAALVALVSCGINEFKNQENKLKKMVSNSASKSEIMSDFGTNFISYSIGRASWSDLSNILSREAPNRMLAVRERAGKWPNIMLYSSPEMMTWIFLDEKERIADFVVGAQ